MLRFLGLTRMNRYVYAPKDDDWRRDYTEQDIDRFKQLLRAADEVLAKDTMFSLWTASITDAAPRR